MKIYNTLTGKKDILKPLKNKRVNLFVCGPTVYDFSHIGHARIYIIFDCFVKYLKKLGYDVFYLQNITDIDDKIIARAKEKEVSVKDLATAFEKEYIRNMRALGITSVRKYAKATSYIKEIISQIKKLHKKGYAYQLDDGIYFNIAKFKNYGKLAGRTALQAEDAVSRIDYSGQKKNRGDFCLWKFAVSAEGELRFQRGGEPFWRSPFGKGRPGWHIEDTAITEKFFGPQYDIHGGGRDLIFPHHEAEIAQMEAISGKKPMARIWMHAGFLTINGQKMSKSLKNIISIDDFLKRHSVRHLRFWVAKNLWRSPLDYSESAMIETKLALERIEEFLRKFLTPMDARRRTPRRVAFQFSIKTHIFKSKFQKLLKKTSGDFYGALADDFNTPKAFAAIFDFIKETNKFLKQNPLSKKESDEIFGFFAEVNKIFDIIDFKKINQPNIPKEVKELLKERNNCRKIGNWNKADEIRAEIEKYGFIVEDAKRGAIVRKMQ